MAQTVTFDMYVRADDRWQHYAQFIELERDDAVATAKQLDQEPGVEGVRIIRVTAYGGNRAPLETLEWISPGLKRNAAPAPNKNPNPSHQKDLQDAATQAASGATAEAARQRRQQKPCKPSVGGTNRRPQVARGAGIIAIASLLSVGLYVPTGFVMKYLAQSGLPVSPLYQEIAAFTICAIVFLLLTGICFRLFITTDDLVKPRNRVKPGSKDKTRPTEAAPVAMDRTPTTTETPPSERPIAAVPANGDSLFTPNLQEGEGASDRAQTTAPETPQERPTSYATTLDEKYRMAMLRFLEGSLSELADILTTLDQYSRFGINLFLGGAGDRFSATHELGGIQRFILIRETISALGTEADMVDLFCEKFDAYDEDPKYHFMTEAGRRILDKYLAGDANCYGELPELIRRWRRSAAATAQAQGIIVIMFTDLVGSTQMTHDHGDHGAQEVVRAHNAVVRNALAQYHGEEVKHTGDGIMASFANAANSVRAAIKIQREIANHNRLNPNLLVRVRIGLNAGDAVREEDDIFGHTVQLAARICDKADEREIYITPSVFDLCSDHAFDIGVAGHYELKGIDEPVRAYAVNWHQTGKTTDDSNE